MRINKQEFQMVALDGVTDRLKEHPRNPKRGNTEAIGESIDASGFFGAVLAQSSTGYILAGNHKYRTAVRKGAKEVPVLWIDVDDETALRILLADNRIAELGYVDEAALDAILAELPSLTGTGYGLAAAEAAIEEAEASAAAEEPGSVPGADEVPEDAYESQFGVIVMCEDADHQREVYEVLQALGEGAIYLGSTQGTRHLPPEQAEKFNRVKLRLVAV